MNATVVLLMLGSLAIKATTVLFAAFAAVRLLHRSSAAMRSLVWSAALGGVLLLPVVIAATPKWELHWSTPNWSVPRREAESQTARAAHPELVVINQDVDSISAEAIGKAIPRPQFEIIGTKIAVAGLITWLVGMICVLAQLAVGVYRVCRAWNDSRAISCGQAAIAESAHRQLGVRRPIEVRLAAPGCELIVPATWGVLRPVILLPQDSVEWSEECTRSALLHENAHVTRLDWIRLVLSRILCAIFWFNPLVWLAARYMRFEGEAACDDLVLGAGLKATDYAQHLISVVSRMPAGQRRQGVAIAMAQPTEIELRVKSLLSRERSHRPATRAVRSFVNVVAAATILPLAAAHITTAAHAAASPITDAVSATTAGRLPFVSQDPDLYSQTLRRSNLMPIRTTRRSIVALHAAALAFAAPVAMAQAPAIPPTSLVTQPASSDTANTILLKVSITKAEADGSVVTLMNPSIVTVSGKSAQIAMDHDGRHTSLLVTATVSTDKTVLIDAEITDKAAHEAAESTIHPRIKTLLGQAASVTISDTHGDLTFGVTATVTNGNDLSSTGGMGDALGSRSSVTTGASPDSASSYIATEVSRSNTMGTIDRAADATRLRLSSPDRVAIIEDGQKRTTGGGSGSMGTLSTDRSVTKVYGTAKQFSVIRGIASDDMAGMKINDPAKSSDRAQGDTPAAKYLTVHVLDSRTADGLSRNATTASGTRSGDISFVSANKILRVTLSSDWKPGDKYIVTVDANRKPVISRLLPHGKPVSKPTKKTQNLLSR